MKTETGNNAADTLTSLTKLLVDMGYTSNDLYLLGVNFFKEKEGGKALEVPYKERIQMLALIKQAKFGKYVSNTLTDVGILNLAGNDMKRVWMTFKDMPKEEAMKQFLTKLINFSPLFDPYVRAHIELEKKRQKEDLDHVLESERSRMEQERSIRTELNRQTERQFKEYAAYMYPRNQEAQNRLIEGLQEQHFTQYMDQAYNFRLHAMNQSAVTLVISTPPQSDPYNPNTPLQQTSVVKEVRMPDIPHTKNFAHNKAQAQIYTGWTPTWVGHGDSRPKEFVREILPPDLPKPKSSKIVNDGSQQASISNGNSGNEKPKGDGKKIVGDSKIQNEAKQDKPKKDNKSSTNNTGTSENTKKLIIDDKESKRTKKFSKISVVTSQDVLSYVAESNSNNNNNNNNSNNEISFSSTKQNDTISENLRLIEEDMKSDQTSDVTERESKVTNNSNQKKKKNIINYDSSTISEKVISKTSGFQEEPKESNGSAKVEPGNIWMRKDRESFLKTARSEPESRINVAAGESVTIRIPPNESGKGLFCEFATDSYDVGFGLFFEHLRSTTISEENREDNEKDLDGDIAAASVARGKGWKARRIIDKIIPVERRNSNVDVICVSHVYPPYEGVYHIKFDNSFSYWHSKTIYYRIYYTR